MSIADPNILRAGLSALLLPILLAGCPTGEIPAADGFRDAASAPPTSDEPLVPPLELNDEPDGGSDAPKSRPPSAQDPESNREADAEPDAAVPKPPSVPDPEFQSPAEQDSDGDGLIDAEELALGTSIHLPDTDLDGLSDGQEVELGTDPLNPDSDGDFLPDELEQRTSGLDPLVPNRITSVQEVLCDAYVTIAAGSRDAVYQAAGFSAWSAGDAVALDAVAAPRFNLRAGPVESPPVLLGSPERESTIQGFRRQSGVSGVTFTISLRDGTDWVVDPANTRVLGGWGIDQRVIVTRGRSQFFESWRMVNPENCEHVLLVTQEPVVGGTDP